MHFGVMDVTSLHSGHQNVSAIILFPYRTANFNQKLYGF
jgi:hypothetical protein